MVDLSFKIFLILMALQRCHGVIYKLNDSVYNSLPALFAMDDYDSCLQNPGGVYCVAKFQVYAREDIPNELIDVIQEYSKFQPRHYDHNFIDRGICVTRHCLGFLQNKTLFEKRDQDAILAACVNDTVWKEHHLQAKLTHAFYCDRREVETVLDTGDGIVAALFIVILVANLIGSFYHVIVERNSKGYKVKGNPYLLSLSIKRNFQWLTSKSSDPKTEQLNGFYGLKTIVAICVVAAHTVNPYGNGFIDNPSDLEKTYDEVKYKILFNGLMAVQMFFSLSGFLLIYMLKLKVSDGKLSWRMFPKICLLRWWRLTPACAVMIAFSATWIRHLGSGPLWNLYVTVPADDCKGYWWQFLIYINNYDNSGRFCSFQTWSLAAEFQLSVLGVFIYLATRSRGRQTLLVLLLVVGTLLPALQVWLQDLDGTMLLTPEFFRTGNSETFFKLYIPTHTNMPSFITGMATALLVHKWETEGVDLSKYKVLRILLWLTVPATICFFYSGSVFSREAARAPLLARALYAALQRLVMAVIVAFVMTGLVMRVDPVLSRIFEWDGWRVPGRLSYCVFLLHVILIQLVSGSKTQLIHFTLQNLLMTQLAVAVMSFIVALPVYLLVEAPAIALSKALTDKRERTGHGADG